MKTSTSTETFVLDEELKRINRLARLQSLPVLLTAAAFLVAFLCGLWPAITGTILAAGLLALLARIRLVGQLRWINGEYLPHDIRGNLIDGTPREAKFGPWISLIRPTPELVLYQRSTEGDWLGVAPISEFNPNRCLGIAWYASSGRGARNELRGGREGNWGSQELTLNKHFKSIYVLARNLSLETQGLTELERKTEASKEIPEPGIRVNEYILKKISKVDA